MPTLEFEVEIAAPLEAVWAFHQDPVANLPALCMPESQARIESADMPVAEGSRVVIVARGPLGRTMRLVARITQVVPPHAVVFGQEARFVDELEDGPFAFWKHEHEFEALDSNRTRMVDRLTYRIGWGPLGWIADLLVARRQLRAMFRHRHMVTRQRLEQSAPGK